MELETTLSNTSSLLVVVAAAMTVLAEVALVGIEHLLLVRLLAAAVLLNLLLP